MLDTVDDHVAVVPYKSWDVLVVSESLCCTNARSSDMQEQILNRRARDDLLAASGVK